MKVKIEGSVLKSKLKLKVQFIKLLKIKVLNKNLGIKLLNPKDKIFQLLNKIDN